MSYEDKDFNQSTSGLENNKSTWIDFISCLIVVAIIIAVVVFFA